jgi:hypothetical protein
MKAQHIRIRPDRLNAPLATCNVGKLSSAVFVIEGDIPDDTDTIAVQIGRTPDPQTQEPRKNFTASASETTPQGSAARAFRCYLAPFCFPDEADALEYHVVATDTTGNSRWLGTGQLIVRDNPADGSPVAPEIIPADTYIRNPATGLYHKLTAAVDEDGNLTVALEDEGIER